MSADLIIRGAGGDPPAATPHVAVEDPNSLQSKAYARIVEIYSEGEVWGLVDNASSIYLNDQPAINPDGTLLFPGFDWDQRFGTSGQTAIVPGFPEIQQVISVGVDVVAATPIIRQIPDADVVSARVVITLTEGLSATDKTTGDIHGTSVEWAIDTRLEDGVWTQVFDEVVSGKTMSAYERQAIVYRPAAQGVWEVRVRRVSADPADSYSHSKFRFTEMTTTIDAQHSYPDTALIGVIFDSASTGGQIPVRSYHVKGRMIQVPSNYDPVTRIYTGPWDGTFQIAYSNNPAWCIYDMLSNVRYGLGEVVATAQIDVWSFYDCGVYCDEFIDAGFGDGTVEPRFTLNTQITTQQPSWKLLQAMASCCRSVIIGGGSLIQIVQDRPTDMSSIFTKSDIIGAFNYQTTAKQQRFTTCLVTFADPTNLYKPKTVSWPDAAGLALDYMVQAFLNYGYQVQDIGAFGCTSEGQAKRLARWQVDTALTQTRTLTFKTGLNRAFVKPGDVVGIMDEDFVRQPYGGRIVSGSTTTALIIDRTVTLVLGFTYFVQIISADGQTIEKKTLVNTPGDYTSLLVDTPFLATPTPNHTWMIYQGELILYKIMTVKETERGVFENFGVVYDPTKFGRSEEGIVVAHGYIPPSLGTIGPPTNLTIVRDLVLGVGALRIDWVAPVTGGVGVTYNLQWRLNLGAFTSAPAQGSTEYFITPISAGTYDVSITATNLIGATSSAATASYTVGSSGDLNPSLLAVNDLLTNPGGLTTFTGQNLFIKWTDPNTYGGELTFQSYLITITDPSSFAVVHTDSTSTASYVYSFATNSTDSGGPRRDLVVTVAIEDAFGAVSPDTSVEFTNAVEPTPTFTLTAALDVVYVTITSTLPADHQGFEVYGSTVTGFSPGPTNLLVQSAGTVIPVPLAAGTWYIRVAGIDSFGTTGELFAAQQSIVVTSATSGTTAGTYKSVTVTAGGLVSAGTNPTTLAGFGITDAHPLAYTQNSKSANYTTVLSDSGGHILHPSADTTARTFTIAANSSVAYSVGTELIFVNQHSAGTLTIAITSDTMRLAGAGTTGSRTLAADNIARALKITTTEWLISGSSGLT